MVCSLAIVGMGITVTYEIIARYLFNAPTTWAQEISIFFLLALALLGLAPTLAADEHIRIDLLTHKLPRPVQRWLQIATLAAIAVYAAIAAVGGFEIVRQSLRFGRKSLTLLEVPVWIPQTLLPIGMALLALTAVVGIAALLSEPKANGSG
jgi:TRAP-type C4-dicarboxylate transport system permease small subunit